MTDGFRLGFLVGKERMKVDALEFVPADELGNAHAYFWIGGVGRFTGTLALGEIGLRELRALHMEIAARIRKRSRRKSPVRPSKESQR